MSPVARDFLSSFAEDRDIADIDIDVAEVHALALRRGGILAPGELKKVLVAYERARRRVKGILSRQGGSGAFHDIHPLVEKMVLDACGEEAGGKVHLGKSRNDQVATDICIHARRGVARILGEVAGLKRALVSLAARNARKAVPAYTHMRPGQATTVGHYLLSYVASLERDFQRLASARERLNRCPLGACAVAGTSVPVDRKFTSRLLGFDGPWTHALDATSARDHVLETMSATAIMMSTLSRLAADLIFMTSDDTGLYSYPERWADTSSAMPQKRNPDPLELVRARAGMSSGLLAAALAIMHGQPSGYNRDMQELKVALWRALDSAAASAAVVRGVVAGLELRPERARAILEGGYAAALDIAEWLCLARGVPFRRAHFAVGRLVRGLQSSGRTFPQAGAREVSRILSGAAGRQVPLSESEWRRISDAGEGAMRRRQTGSPGTIDRLLRAARANQRRLEREVRSMARSEGVADRMRRRAVAAAVRRPA